VFRSPDHGDHPITRSLIQHESKPTVSGFNEPRFWRGDPAEC
jgi:hypothetical protein